MKLFSILIFIFFVNIPFTLHAQVDIGSWSSLQLNYKAGDKVTLIAKPIVRHDSDLSNYSDTSIDFIVAYKINAAWSANVLNRHFFIPDVGDREFWFFDINYKFLLTEKLTFSNKLRYHLAVNWNRNDADFIRYHPKFSLKTKTKITPFVGSEFFYKLTGNNALSGVRYVLGLDAAFSKKTKLTLQYWRQTKYKEEHPLGETHTFLLNLTYFLN